MGNPQTSISHFGNIYSGDNKKDVLLVFPGKFKAPDPLVPLSLLHLAASLQEEGFTVRILDMRIEDYRHFEIGNPVFVGISSISGLQIGYALEFARYTRIHAPSSPIVWGGVHPTLLPEQTASNDYVDIVVRGEGELIIKDLANTLVLNEPLDNVAGITYKIENLIKNNPDGNIIDLDAQPITLPYDLLQMDMYPAVKSGRFHIQTSRGCPHRCGFCYNIYFNKNKWRAKSANRVIDEIEYILTKFPQVKIIDPVDDNFLLTKNVLKKYAEKF